MTINAFFEKNAADFTARRLEACADTLAVPAVIHVGDRQIFVSDRAQVLEMLTTYRRNLDVEAYTHTEAEVHHVTDDQSNQWQAFVTWRNFNDQGAVISTFDASYILFEPAPGRFQCATAEIISPVKERLLTGLPVASVPAH